LPPLLRGNNVSLNMESLPLEKFNGINFHTWKVKIQMHLMNKGLWSIVKGNEKAPTDVKLLSEWEKKEDKAKAIIGLALSDTQLHLVDLAKSSKEIWEQLSKLFGEKAINAKFSLKLQLFSLKMHDETPLANHINDLMSLLRQLIEIGAKVDAEDAKAILLNSLSPKYNNIVFTLSQLSSQSLEGMIASLLAEEKRTNTEDTDIQHGMALFSKGKMKKTKGSKECFYCHKYGHIAWNCRIRAKDLLNGKESANLSNLDDSSESDSDEEPSSKTF
jgi:hypothetical protein